MTTTTITHQKSTTNPILTKNVVSKSMMMMMTVSGDKKRLAKKSQCKLLKFSIDKNQWTNQRRSRQNQNQLAIEYIASIRKPIELFDAILNSVLFGNGTRNLAFMSKINSYLHFVFKVQIHKKRNYLICWHFQTWLIAFFWLVFRENIEKIPVNIFF